MITSVITSDIETVWKSDIENHSDTPRKGGVLRFLRLTRGSSSSSNCHSVADTTVTGWDWCHIAVPWWPADLRPFWIHFAMEETIKENIWAHTKHTRLVLENLERRFWKILEDWWRLMKAVCKCFCNPRIVAQGLCLADWSWTAQAADFVEMVRCWFMGTGKICSSHPEFASCFRMF